MTLGPSPATLFGIIRHAPTIWNEQKRIQGLHDSPLSHRGQLMAQEWGTRLSSDKWDRILCSDLDRVQQTAELVNRSLDLSLQTDPQLREQDWGDWTGMTLSEVKKQDKELLRQQELKGWDFRPPSGESRHEVLQRSVSALSDAHASFQGEKVLVVCHEGVIKCLLYHILGRKFLPEEPQVIHNYNLHLLVMENSNLFLETMNYRSLPIIDEQAGE